MTLAVLLATASILAGWLGLTSVARTLARRDHRCVLRTRSASCQQCAAVVRGDDVGGHVVCACSAVSPHLVGAGLLRWRAAHHGERFPALPGESGPAAQGPATVLAEVSPAEAAASRNLADGVAEAEHRAVARARRNPDPVTPQVLREAGYTSPAHGPQTAHAQEAAETDAVDGHAGTL